VYGDPPPGAGLRHCIACGRRPRVVRFSSAPSGVIGMGVIGGNLLGFQTTPWIDFLATFGSGLLTFLAGAEIEPESLRRHLKPTLVIGSLSFSAPFVAAWLFAQHVAGWELHQAGIAGIAPSTTSAAVVCAVMTFMLFLLGGSPPRPRVRQCCPRTCSSG
jgi:Sodium/hydrogen exchanger family